MPRLSSSDLCDGIPADVMGLVSRYTGYRCRTDVALIHIEPPAHGARAELSAMVEVMHEDGWAGDAKQTERHFRQQQCDNQAARKQSKRRKIRLHHFVE